MNPNLTAQAEASQGLPRLGQPKSTRAREQRQEGTAEGRRLHRAKGPGSLQIARRAHTEGTPRLRLNNTCLSLPEQLYTVGAQMGAMQFLGSQSRATVPEGQMGTPVQALLWKHQAVG